MKNLAALWLLIALTFVAAGCSSQTTPQAERPYDVSYAEINPKDASLELVAVGCVIRLGQRWENGMPAEPARERLIIRSFLQNISTSPVTVPTRLPGGLSEWWSGGNHWSYRAHQYFDRPLQPSPYLFAPVTLAPGESTEIDEYRKDSEAGALPSVTEVAYSVEKSLGDRFGWWVGHLKAKVKMEGTKEPNQSSEPTPTAGTSAAEQPLVPAAVVAHL
jgi:hypothetical protein